MNFCCRGEFRVGAFVDGREGHAGFFYAVHGMCMDGW